MNWRELFRNKWLLGGLGVAALAGLFVLYRRSQGAGGEEAAPESRSSPAYAGGGIGTFDSTGTDVAAWLGSQQTYIQNQFKEFLDQLTDATEAAAKIPPKPGIPAPRPGGQTGPIIPKPVPKPAPKPVPGGTKKYVTVVRYTKSNPSWASTLSGIARHEGTSVTKLMQLNPSIKNANIIYTGQKVRVA